MLAFVPTLIVITIIIALYNKKTYANTVYKYFFYFLIYTILTELAGYIVGYIIGIPYKLKNHFVYNTYIIINFVFYLLFYKNLFRKKSNKKIVTIFLILYLLFTVSDFIFLDPPFLTGLISINFTVGSIFLIITIILFLFEIINNELVLNLKKSLIFWISVGVLLFFIGVLPIFIASEFLGFKGIYKQILYFLNVILYGCFSLGFILSEKKYLY